MDSITQAALGGLCGERLLRKQLGWKGALWGVFFGTLPDLDVLMSPWLDAMDSLRNHRSLSHSLFLMLLMSPLFGWLLSKLHRSVSTARTSVFVLLAWFTHVLIDCFNSYGTQVLEPFSDYRVAFGNMAIIDLFFTLPILLGNFFCLFCHKGGKNRSRIVTITTLWISLYALASIGFQAMARNAFRERLASQNHSDIEMLVSPTLTNIFLWRMIARDDENFYISYWSLFDAADRPVHISTIVRSDESATPYLGSKEFETLDWFSKGWWKVFPAGQDSNSIYFVDMRFGEIQNFNTDPTIRSTPFMWKLSIGAHGEITDQRTRVREELDAKAVLKQLQERIAGRAPEWHQGIWPWEIQ